MDNIETVVDYAMDLPEANQANQANQVNMETSIYKMRGETKVPVGRGVGMLVKSRRDAALAKRKNERTEDAWREALRYYNNDQLGHRLEAGPDRSGNTGVGLRINGEWSETENMVFANTAAMVPMIYAKNPVVEFTAVNSEQEKFVKALEKVVNTLVGMRRSPGVNLKPKARQAVVHAALTNCAWIKLDWTQPEFGLGAGQAELMDLAKRYAEAKTPKEVMELEGKLMALEEKIETLGASGVSLKFRSAFDVLVDPDSEELDGIDGKWMMEKVMLPTQYLNAVYGEKNDKGEVVAVYDATHVMDCGENGQDELTSGFRLLDGGEDYKNYGYGDKASFDKSKMTCCWYYWDKVTKRVMLFADNKWEWPVWVWDDPLSLRRFFPYYKLYFHVNPVNNNGKGEVTYYLDQQDAINEINDEERRARLWAKRNIFYNKRLINREDAEAFLKGPDGTATGIDLPEGAKMGDAVFSGVPPSAAFTGLFSVERKMAAIDRITGLNDALRGNQFKTNTTNKAIDNYQAVTQLRIDEKIDCVEDFLGDICAGIAELCAYNMTQQDVVDLVGAQTAQDWRNLAPGEFDRTVVVKVAAGSTQKPTSQIKKQEAIQVGQVLGQFAQAAPQTVMKALLMVFERAFDEVVFSDEDWQMLRSEMMSKEEGAQQVEQLVDGMPPEAKQALGQLIAQGMPVKQAVMTVIQQVQQQQGGADAGATAAAG